MVVYLDNIIKFNKNSSSPTNVYFADLVRDDQSKTPVAIKAFIKLDINFYNQLRESKIIKKVLTEEEINKAESNLDKYNIKIEKSKKLQSAITLSIFRLYSFSKFFC